MSKAQAFLETWHKAVKQSDMEILSTIVAENASLLSPAFWKPREGKDKVLMVLAAVTETFQDLTYTKEWVDGDELILEFTTSVDGKQMKGIDRITLDENGKLKEIEVLIRPMNGLMALAAALNERLTGVVD